MKNTFSNYDDPILANERLKNKLDFLQRQSVKRQIYLKDLEYILKSKIQTINSLTSQNKDIENIISRLNQQTYYLHTKLKQDYDAICKMNALYLMECQLRIQQKKSYNQRISEFQNTMVQLRRYLHDKQDSFSCVVQKLKKYQQIGSEVLGQKFRNYSALFIQDTAKQAIKALSAEKELYKTKYIELENKLYQYQDKLSKTKQHSVSNSYNKQYIQTALESNNKKNSFRFKSTETHIQKRNESNLSTNITTTLEKRLQPNVQLIRLMKKQKLSNQILQQALIQAIQKNQLLINYNKRLIENNSEIRKQMDYIIADMVILCQKLTNYDLNYHVKLKLIKKRSKQDKDLPSYQEIIKKYILNDIKQAENIVFNRLRNDVNQIGQFIPFCQFQNISKNLKSCQTPRKTISYENQNQISLNQDQFSIHQI